MYILKYIKLIVLFHVIIIFRLAIPVVVINIFRIIYIQDNIEETIKLQSEQFKKF